MQKFLQFELINLQKNKIKRKLMIKKLQKEKKSIEMSKKQ